MSKTIYFVRHGESQSNVDGVYAGQTETPLTKLGREQAKKAGLQARGLKIEYIVSSDLGRAYDTARIIATEIGLLPERIVLDQRLREVDLGKLVGTPSLGINGYLKYANVKDNSMKVEYLEDIKQRLQSLLDDLEKSDKDHILLVSHNGPSLIIEAMIQNTLSDLGAVDRRPNAKIFKLPERVVNG